MGKKEMLDIFNGKGEYIGIKDRAEVHKDGDWHKTFHCWIVFRNNEGEDMVILQKRSENKKSWPGYVDISAAGHLEAGETSLDGLRELEEELGIKATSDNLIDAGIRVCVEEFKEGAINHEFQNIYFLIEDKNVFDYNIQGEELSGILEIKIDDLLSLFANEIDSVYGNGFILDKNGKKIKEKYSIQKNKFIPTLDNYYYRVMIQAKRVLNSEKHIHI